MRVSFIIIYLLLLTTMQFTLNVVKVSEVLATEERKENMLDNPDNIDENNENNEHNKNKYESRNVRNAVDIGKAHPHLPADMMKLIFEFLGTKEDLASTQLVSKDWDEFVKYGSESQGNDFFKDIKFELKRTVVDPEDTPCNQNPIINFLQSMWNQIKKIADVDKKEELKEKKIQNFLMLIENEGLKVYKLKLPANETGMLILNNLRMFPHLQELKLSSYGNYGDKCASKLANTIIVNKTLKKLDLSVGGKGDITDVGLEKMAQALEVNNSLESFNLHRSVIGNNGMMRIFQALRVNGNSGLKELNISCIYNDNKSVLDVTEIAKTFRSNKKLQDVDLSQNGLGRSAIVTIVEALEDNKSLKNLSLAYNSIGALREDEDETLLFQAFKKLKNNTSLQSLDLSGNGIGDNDAINIFKALKDNKSLRKLTLTESNRIGRNGLVGIIEALKGNKSLEDLEMGSFYFISDQRELYNEFLKLGFKAKYPYTDLFAFHRDRESNRQ
ncbi:MAG: hypothetical protein HQK49_12600 [Oligoflexia bacterium]|nr:hypothetical protein [Oligoflexia bacterium]